MICSITQNTNVLDHPAETSREMIDRGRLIF